MRLLIFQWRHAWWNFILLAFLLSAAIANAQTALSLSPITFGEVTVGNSKTLPVSVSNNGKTSLTIFQESVIGTGFSFSGPTLPLTLAPQQSVSLNVTFSPETGGIATGSMSVVAERSIVGSEKRWRTSISLTGTGLTPAYLSVSPPSMNLGSVPVGSSQQQALTLSNSGGSSLTIWTASVSGPGFSAGGLSFPYTLAAGASANLSVVFAPTAAGLDSAILSFSSNASDSSVGVALSGIGTSPTGTIGVTPGVMSFGNVDVGSSQTQNGSVSASGGSVTLSSATSNNSQFTIGGLTFPVTIAVGQNVPFTVTFSPTAAGSTSSDISFFTGTASASETATGTGVTIQHTVELSWVASQSPSINGYNVYRAMTTGGPYSKINTSLNETMNYSDITVQSGQTYYYVTTAVNSSGVESGYSDQVTVPIP